MSDSTPTWEAGPKRRGTVGIIPGAGTVGSGDKMNRRTAPLSGNPGCQLLLDLSRLPGRHGQGLRLIKSQGSPPCSFRGERFGKPLNEFVDEQLDEFRRVGGDMRQDQAIGKIAEG